jgi:hypothetical protein
MHITATTKKIAEICGFLRILIPYAQKKIAAANLAQL